MRTVRLQVLGWLLVLIPTAIAAMRLLQGSRLEHELLHRRLRDAALAQAGGLAGELRLAAADVRDNVASTLETIGPSSWIAELSRWAADDPRLSQAFVWEPPDRLLWPPEGPAQTQAARAFRHRYRALFEGRHAWETPADDPMPPGAAAPSPMRMVGRGLQSAAQPAGSQEGIVRWTPWFDDNRLHLLAWRRDPAAGRIGGVEVELMSLLSRLIPAFHETSLPDGMRVQLRDAAGQTLHHSGSSNLPETLQPDRRFSLGPELPSWELAVFLPPAEGASRTLDMAMGLTVGALVCAVLAGGFLLTREAARERREARRQTGFVSNVSHELKTPLTGIRLYAELLAEDRVPAAQRRRYFEIMLSECGRLSRLIGNVLDFGRLEQGKRRFRQQDVDLADSVKTVCDTVRPQVEAAGMRLELAIPPPCRVLADPDALEQVVSNLLDNALKYAAEGGVARFEATVEDDRVVLRVMDRGPGVAASRRRGLFGAFQGGDAHLSAERHGAGLGLSIVKGLTEGMGGTIEYRPRPGGGAVFEMRLPRGTETEEQGDDRENTYFGG